MKARYLRQTALDELRDAIPGNVEVYRSGSFPNLIADTSKFFTVGFEVDEAKLGELRVPDDGRLFEEHNCTVGFDAMPELSAYEARDERLWTYLTHTLMLDYTRKRWPIPDDDEEAADHIRTHFFAKEKRQIERDNAASRL